MPKSHWNCPSCDAPLAIYCEVLHCDNYDCTSEAMEEGVEIVNRDEDSAFKKLEAIYKKTINPEPAGQCGQKKEPCKQLQNP